MEEKVNLAKEKELVSASPDAKESSVASLVERVVEKAEQKRPTAAAVGLKQQKSNARKLGDSTDKRAESDNSVRALEQQHEWRMRELELKHEKEMAELRLKYECQEARKKNVRAESESGDSYAENVKDDSVTRRQIMTRKCIPEKLPTFNGDPEMWPLFYSSYCDTTSACGFSNMENLQRLRECLRGKALEAVKGRLLLPESVPNVIEDLKCLFGRPERLLKRLIEKVRTTPAPNPNRLGTFLTFGIAVKQLCDHLQGSKMVDHLSNPTLVDELVQKLPAHYKMEWARFKRHACGKPLCVFADFIDDVMSDVAEVADIDEVLEDKEKVKNRRDVKGNVFMHTAAPKSEQISPAKTAKCYKCSSDQHRVRDCEEYKNASPEERLAFAQNMKLCTSCLNNHRGACHFRQKCSVSGCSENLHPLLHQSQAESNMNQCYAQIDNRRKNKGTPLKVSADYMSELIEDITEMKDLGNHRTQVGSSRVDMRVHHHAAADEKENIRLTSENLQLTNQLAEQQKHITELQLKLKRSQDLVRELAVVRTQLAREQDKEAAMLATSLVVNNSGCTVTSAGLGAATSENVVSEGPRTANEKPMAVGSRATAIIPTRGQTAAGAEIGLTPPTTRPSKPIGIDRTGEFSSECVPEQQLPALVLVREEKNVLAISEKSAPTARASEIPNERVSVLEQNPTVRVIPSPTVLAQAGLIPATATMRILREEEDIPRSGECINDADKASENDPNSDRKSSEPFNSIKFVGNRPTRRKGKPPDLKPLVGRFASPDAKGVTSADNVDGARAIATKTPQQPEMQKETRLAIAANDAATAAAAAAGAKRSDDPTLTSNHWPGATSIGLPTIPLDIIEAPIVSKFIRVVWDRAKDGRLKVHHDPSLSMKSVKFEAPSYTSDDSTQQDAIMLNDFGAIDPVGFQMHSLDRDGPSPMITNHDPMPVTSSNSSRQPQPQPPSPPRRSVESTRCG